MNRWTIGTALAWALMTLTATAHAGYTYQYQFGSPGSGNGQLANPFGVAVDGSGNVYVVDASNRRVEEFSNTGTFLRAFGTYGSGDGQFDSPTGVAVDGTGHVFVTDYGNSRVEEFSSTGNFLRTISTLGSGDGQVSSPYGVAVDGLGNVFVADSGNQRVEEFSATGAFLRTFGTVGSGDGQFFTPDAVAVDDAGHVFVTDNGNDRVEEFSTTGTFLKAFGTYGSGDGQLHGPYGVAVDGSGNVFVADTFNSRVQEFSVTGTFLTAFGTETSGDGQVYDPTGVALDGAGNVFVTDNSGRVAVFAQSVPEPSSLVLMGLGATVAAVARARSGRARRRALTHRVGRVETRRVSAAGSRPCLHDFSDRPTNIPGVLAMHRLIFPALVVAAGLSIAVDRADAGFGLLVSDYGANNILKFNQAGVSSTFVSSVGQPTGMAFDSSGNLYVNSSGSEAILKYSSTGGLIGTFAPTYTNVTGGIAFDSSGNLYNPDPYGRVNEYSPTGAFLKVFAPGESGYFTADILIDPKGDVFISVGANSGSAIYEYSSTGSLLTTITSHLDAPSQMVLDASGNLYVTNAYSGTIEKFSSSGTDLGTFATGTGGFNLGLAYDPSTGIFYQSSYTAGTIQEFSSSGVSLGYLATGLNEPYFLAPAVSSVPEPASLAMLGTGTLIAAGYGALRSIRSRRRVASAHV